MRFKIDKNLERVAAEIIGPADLSFVAENLCKRFVESGMIEDENEHWGESVLAAMGPQYVKDVCNILAVFLYGESRSIPADVFAAFCRLIIVGDGDCPHCGGRLNYIETEGHELNDGDYYTPNSYVIDNYIYRCADCGKTIKSSIEL